MCSPIPFNNYCCKTNNFPEEAISRKAPGRNRSPISAVRRLLETKAGTGGEPERALSQHLWRRVRLMLHKCARAARVLHARDKQRATCGFIRLVLSL